MVLTFQFDWYAFIVIPLLIIVAKITESSIGTIRIMFISQGRRYLAPLVGFFEIIIWLTAASQVLTNISNVPNFVAYALGFTLGNYVGILIEKRISLGYILIRVITKRDATELVAYLNQTGYHVTHMDAIGEHGPVKVLFFVARRKQFDTLIGLIKHYNPHAYYTVEDIRFVSEIETPMKIKHNIFSRFVRPHSR